METILLNIYFTTYKIGCLKELIKEKETWPSRNNIFTFYLISLGEVIKYPCPVFIRDSTQIVAVKTHKKVSTWWHLEMLRTKSFIIHNPSGTCLGGKLQRDQNIAQMFSQVTPKAICKLIWCIFAWVKLLFKLVSAGMKFLYFSFSRLFYLWNFSL